MNKGKIVQIIGVVVDIEFLEKLPAIYNALEIQLSKNKKLILEVEQILSENRVRAVAMGPTDGLARGAEVIDTNHPINVPVGKAVLGRLFNVFGETIDGKPDLPKTEKRSIHQKAPQFSEQSTETEIFETGIKVIDLIAPFTKGGKIGLFGGAGLEKLSLFKN